nr:hypothetical protein Iba_chr06cCG12370 [Ipomoea batatas]
MFASCTEQIASAVQSQYSHRLQTIEQIRSKFFWRKMAKIFNLDLILVLVDTVAFISGKELGKVMHYVMHFARYDSVGIHITLCHPNSDELIYLYIIILGKDGTI